jgi:outer membrane protein assembly factor BamB
LERPNPNSAAIWHYEGNNVKKFEETMHRSCGTVAIKDDLLFIADFSGVFHCVDVNTGKAHWTYDMLAACWGSPLIVENRVYISDEDGDVTVFELSKEMNQIAENSMGSAVYTSPIVANNTIFAANRNRVFAIQEGAQSDPVK